MTPADTDGRLFAAFGDNAWGGKNIGLRALVECADEHVKRISTFVGQPDVIRKLIKVSSKRNVFQPLSEEPTPALKGRS